MLTAEKKKRYTDRDYSLLEEGAPFQLIHNDLVMSPSPSILHQRIFVRISNIIAFFSAAYLKGEWFYAPTDVWLDDGNVYQPDILYIVENRRAELIKERIEGAPDLIIEILSPSNAYYDLRQKKDIYEKYGVKEYIIVDPIQENAEVHALENGVFTLKQKAAKTQQLNSLLLPGLVFDLSKIFA
ncbi:Uma2 family endonuclease [Mucilaginibacter sp. AW1-3]